MDEAVKLGPALDALIRMKLKVIGVANGQRVPEDWHRLSANALVHRALRGGGSSAYKLDASEVSLIFTAPLGHAARATPLHRARRCAPDAASLPDPMNRFPDATPNPCPDPCRSTRPMACAACSPTRACAWCRWSRTRTSRSAA